MTFTVDAPLDTAITSFRQQASIFSILNLFVIAGLLFLHVLLTPYWGRLSPVLFVALGFGFLFHSAVFIWIQARPSTITAKMILYLTVASIAVNSILTLIAAATNHEDSQYFALMIIPILEAASDFPCLRQWWLWPSQTLSVSIGFGNTTDFTRSQQFNEYIEAGTVSVIYTLVGIIVWLLVNRLKQKEVHMARNLEELRQTRKQLLEEEKLAAVGRLSSAIAHEIRNPVAMISSSLAMANESGATETSRKEMFDIAAKEARRLEKLTGDFLEYAKPQLLEKTKSPLPTLSFMLQARARLMPRRRVVERKG